MHTTLGDWLLELVANALEAGAGALQVEVVQQSSTLTATVTDDGPGIPDDLQCSLFDPWSSGDAHKHPGRRPHLGLPLLDQMVQQAGGTLTVQSAPAAGTMVRWVLDVQHPDTPPPGDWAATVATAFAMAAERGVVLQWCHRWNGAGYTMNNMELLEDSGAVCADGIARLRHRLAVAESDLAEASNRVASAVR